jgi:cysteine desulfurase
MTAYWDAAATTPTDPRVAELVLRLMTEEFGNAGSRTHQAGADAADEVVRARRRVAAAVGAREDEVLFTSGATEANNLALLGLAGHGERTGRRHLLSTAIEHKAVLEPLALLASRGFNVELVRPLQDGTVDPADVLSRVRPDTLAVSVMHANNETGALQPVAEIADGLRAHDAYLHVDAAQTFGKVGGALSDPRVDLVSASGHKVFGPKGVGALIARRRGWSRPPLEPLMVGGGQERGLRPGTVPVPLVAGLGLAAELAAAEREIRAKECVRRRETALGALSAAGAVVNGNPNTSLPHVVNVSFPGADGEAVMLAWRDLVAVSNGSACTSSSYEPSHVLQAMGLPDDRIRGAVRLSWWHGADDVDWDEAARRVAALR